MYLYGTLTRWNHRESVYIFGLTRSVNIVESPFLFHCFLFFFSCINRKTDHAALETFMLQPRCLSALCQTTNHRLHYISQHRVFFSALLYSRKTTVEWMINNQYVHHYNVRGKKKSTGYLEQSSPTNGWFNSLWRKHK